MPVLSASSSFLAALTTAAIVGTLMACGGGLEPSSDGTGSTGSSGAGGGSNSGTSGAAKGNASGSGSSVPPTGAHCNYPPTNNPPGCPPAYITTAGSESCDTIGLKCWYPGAGDGTPDGCWATALLECLGSPDAGADDAGMATGHWMGAQ